LAKVFASAQEWGATYLALMVDRANTDALRSYERRGFVARGDYRNLIREGEGLAPLGPA
jgi:ribosomal protein S18 acetylase RimI-like enzyme